jgi:hypothetical protein
MQQPWATTVFYVHTHFPDEVEHVIERYGKPKPLKTTCRRVNVWRTMKNTRCQ